MEETSAVSLLRDTLAMKLKNRGVQQSLSVESIDKLSTCTHESTEDEIDMGVEILPGMIDLSL